MKHVIAAALAVLVSSTANGREPVTFSLCTSETLSPTLSSTDPARPGRAQVLLSMVEKKTGITIQHVVAPWRRCQLLVERGVVDAVNTVGYAGINIGISVFPMRDGTADTARSLGSVPTLLFRRVGDQADFVDGKFVRTDKPIALLVGRQAAKEAVDRAGWEVDDGAKTVLALAQKLVARQVDLAATADPEFPHLIQTRFKGVLEALPTPLMDSHFYVAFSKQFYARHPEEAERFWNVLGATRIDPEYLRRVSTIQ